MSKNKLTNFTLIAIMNNLKTFEDKKLPSKISYALSKNILELSKEYRIYAKELNKIFLRYEDSIIKDTNGKPQMDSAGIPIVKESVEKIFREEISNLLNIQIEVGVFTIPFEEFDYSDKQGNYDTLSVKEIMQLQSIICDETDIKKEV